MSRFTVGPGLLNRTVAEISTRFRRFLLPGRIASRDGFLQRVTPAVKLVGIFVLVVAVVATRNPTMLAAFLALGLILAWSSNIPLRLFVSRWLFVVLFSMVVVAPQAFLMDGQALIGALGITISDAGVHYVFRFTLRVGAAVSFLTLIILTTRFDAVLGGLYKLRVPPTLVSIMAVTYRYLLLFFTELNRMVLAQRSRTFGRTGIRKMWRRLGNLLGSFFLRTIERGERVQLAARARGGGASMRPYEPDRKLTKYDVAFGIVVATALGGRVVIVWLP